MFLFFSITCTSAVKYCGQLKFYLPHTPSHLVVAFTYIQQFWSFCTMPPDPYSVSTASAFTQNLCSKEGLSLCEQCTPFWEEGLHVFLKGKSLARKTRSLLLVQYPKSWGLSLLRLIRWTVIFFPNERLRLLVQIQGSGVTVLLTEAKRLSSICSEKVEFRANGSPEVGSSRLPPMPLSLDAVPVAPSSAAWVLPVPLCFLLLPCAQGDGRGV